MSSSEDEEPGREREAAGGRLDGLRDDDDGLARLVVAALLAPLEEDVVRVESEVQRVVAQEALRVDGARAARASRRARARRGSGRGSSCRARRGRGRRPCVRGPRAGARAASRRDRGHGRTREVRPRGLPRASAHLVSRRHRVGEYPALPAAVGERWPRRQGYPARPAADPGRGPGTPPVSGRAIELPVDVLVDRIQFSGP